MLEKAIQNKEKPTITFAEYMEFEVAEIEKARQSVEFTKHVQEEFNLDSEILPTKNQFAEIWNKENSRRFKEEMESQYIILGRG